MKIKIRANPRKKSRRRSRDDAGTMRSECSRQPDEPTLTQARGPVDPALLSPEKPEAADVPFVLVLPFTPPASRLSAGRHNKWLRTRRRSAVSAVRSF